MRVKVAINEPSEVKVLRDTIREVGTSVIREDGIRAAQTAATEVADNGLQNGSDVVAVVAADDKTLGIEVENSDTPSEASYDCLRDEEGPEEDGLSCHGRGLLIAKTLVEEAGGSFTALRPKDGVHKAFIQVPAKTKTKPTG